jgi:tetratricopeptide (TPR) repeat protein
MKIKFFFPILLFSGFVFFGSCGNNSKETETKVLDSLTTKLPPALQSLNAKIIADPNNAELYHQRAKYYLNDRKYNEGFDDMKKVMLIDSSKAAYFITLSDLYFVTNQTANSKASLEKCISLDSKNVDAMLKLAELYFYVKKHDDCFKYINMALKVDQYNSKAYFMKGMNYKEIKDTAKAISSMQTAVEQDPAFYNAYIQLGILNAAQKKSIAADYYKNALRVQPKSVEAMYNLGKYYQDMKDYKQAVAIYNALLKIDPQNKFAFFNLGAMDLATKENISTGAIAAFTSAINIDPKYIDAYYARGVCYQLIGDKKNAISDFQICLSIDSQYQPASVALVELTEKK